MNREEHLQDWRDAALRVETEVRKAVIGQDNMVRLINVALFARGHVLLEGDVGVGKTTILRAITPMSTAKASRASSPARCCATASA
jgi:MoxR-like ATPase